MRRMIQCGGLGDRSAKAEPRIVSERSTRSMVVVYKGEAGETCKKETATSAEAARHEFSNSQ